jgi:7-cyano-7-deazaguanine tRNA-ribosyltransferase
VQVYLDNGAFYFLRQNAETERPQYRDFVKKAKPDWYPIPYDSIPTPQMCDDGQRGCFKRTMDINRWYEHDGYVPVIHVSRLLDEYIECIKARTKLANKDRIALGGIVPNLLRTTKAISYDAILKTLERVRAEFRGKELHVFGIGGTATLHIARLLGMDSVDSSGWRNRAARGIIQLPGSGDRVVADLGKWRGRAPSNSELIDLKKCRCPACRTYGIKGLRKSGLQGFCNRATHNLHILLDEAQWIEERLAAGTYARCYKRRLNNSVYVSLVERLVSDLFGR